MKERVPVFPIIAISGLPRVGSMWSFNVARSLVRAAGLALVPEQVLKTDPEMAAIADSYVMSMPADTRCVIKTHTVINPSSSVKVIRNRRDLRDRLFSYFRFTKRNMDERRVAKEVATSMNVDSHYDRWPAARILNIRFESIASDNIGLIRQIAQFMDLPAAHARTLRDINSRFSKPRVRREIAELESRVFDGKGNVKQDVDHDAVVTAFGATRAFDPDSGFQSGHVSDYQPGDWKNLWTDRQKRIVDDAIEQVLRGR